MQIYRFVDRYKDKQICRLIDTQIYRYTDVQRFINIDMQIYRFLDTQIYRYTDIQVQSIIKLFHDICLVEGSFEVKLPTIWAVGKAEVGRGREEKKRREKIREETG